MRRMLLICLMVTVGLALVIAGCGQDDTGDQTEKAPEEVKQAEAMDTTAMDSAAMEHGDIDLDSAEVPHDSL